MIVAKAATTLVFNEKSRRAIGWILVAIFSPAILLISFLCCLGSGMAEHNNHMIDYCFYESTYNGNIPAEFQRQMTEIQSAFTSLDSAIRAINEKSEGNGLDPTQVKAVYYVLSSDGGTDTDSFLSCFYTLEKRSYTVVTTNADGEEIESEEIHAVAIPFALSTSYHRLSSSFGWNITAKEKEAIQCIYRRIAGRGDESYNGSYLRGTAPSVDLDISFFADPTTKNAHDLVAYAICAWESGWGYVWGTYGDVLTESLFAYKLEQYPDGVGSYEDFIRANWLGGRTTDCVGLIKGYGWLSPETMTIDYGTHGMPDIGANQMYYSATESGTIDTMPDIPGLAVWHDGHIGVYIGGGQVIEAMGTKYGVVKTELANRGWTHWLKIPYINYD